MYLLDLGTIIMYTARVWRVHLVYIFKYTKYGDEKCTFYMASFGIHMSWPIMKEREREREEKNIILVSSISILVYTRKWGHSLASISAAKTEKTLLMSSWQCKLGNCIPMKYIRIHGDRTKGCTT